MAEREPIKGGTLACFSTSRQLPCMLLGYFLLAAAAPAQQVVPAPLPSLQYVSLADNEQPANEPPAEVKPEKEDDELDFLKKDIRELSQTRVSAPMMNTEVTSVMRTPTTIGRSPAAIYVITQEMIQRSGATDIPELLRMVPGLEVARANASQWSVTSRGFSSRFANKLLVQIDGRVLYNAVFSGVYWEANLVMLQDIDRIEVIRGPGASVWGANAVNGVINIITKSSKDTQGSLVYGASGNELRGMTNLRYGGKVCDHLTWRAYGMFQDQDQGFLPNDQACDDWRSAQGGFRMDWEPNGVDKMTVQGDVYNGYAGGEYREQLPLFPYQQNIVGDAHMSGGNVLGRWTRDFDEANGWAIQFYYDRLRRNSPLAAGTVDVIDLDFQRQVPWGERHQIVWGAEYRHHYDHIGGSYTVSFDPPDRGLNIYSCFVQDEITLVEDRLFLTVGSKFEYNDYTHFEYQPTVRLLYSLDERRAVWGAISRAVRTPSRVERESLYRYGFIPIAPPPTPPIRLTIIGNEDVQSEELLAYELGYRAQPSDRFSWDMAMFYNQYENLIYSQPNPPSPQWPNWYWPWVNCMDGETYGCELSATFQINPRWKLRGCYTYLRMFLHMDDGYATTGEQQEGWSPINQVYFQSSWDLRHDVNFDMMLRYVDALTTLDIPAYVTMDFRLAWRPTEHFEAALVGRNLLDPRHFEYVRNQGPEAEATEVERGMYGTVTFRY
ncbi:MAG: TonB-dependent receptor [Pirellulales bacterium]|nr:TonB-dependent receptor [Pirellulales bacterium]